MDWPDQLVNDIARRRSVIFLGSGVSRNAVNSVGRQPKTWHEFLTYAAGSLSPNQHIKTLINEKDYLTACEVIRNTLGRSDFNDLLREEFLYPAYKPAQIHESVFNLDSRLVATPNFDKIYETYANAQAGGTVVVKHHFDPDVADQIRGTGRLVLKIHGTIDSPDRMIFTRREYAQAREKYRSFYAILEALSLTHTFLFVGCGVNDPDLRLLLEDTAFRHPSSRPHYFTMPRTGMHQKVRESLESSMNLSVITYSAKDQHLELRQSLQDLVAAVEQAREGYQTSLNW